MAQRKFHEALVLLEEIYESTQDPLCLHQMGCVARAQGRLDTARAHFAAEQASLKPTDFLALALNSCQLGDTALEQSKLALAFFYARQSLEQARKSRSALAEYLAWQLMGKVRRALREAEKAQDCFEEAHRALAAAPVKPLSETGEARLVSLQLHGTNLSGQAAAPPVHQELSAG